MVAATLWNREKTIDFFPVQGTNKDHGIASIYNTDSVVTHLNAKVNTSSSQLLRVRDRAQRRSGFDSFNGSLDMQPYCMFLNLANVLEKALSEV
jgi:hypothetical protein